METHGVPDDGKNTCSDEAHAEAVSGCHQNEECNAGNCKPEIDIPKNPHINPRTRRFSLWANVA